MRRLLRSLTIGIGAFICACASLAAAEVKVLAAASLTDVLKELAPAYEAKSGDKIVFNFAASSTLARQIREGAPADLFFSADTEQMGLLEREKLLRDGSWRTFLYNTLVMIVPLDSPLTAVKPGDLGSLRLTRLALADPRLVPAGVYARKYLERLGYWRQWESRVVPTENVRATLAAVASGNVEAGFVYKTDAALSNEVRVVLEVPREEMPRIAYALAVVRDSREPESATKFAEYLGSRPALEVFAKFGFITE